MPGSRHREPAPDRGGQRLRCARCVKAAATGPGQVLWVRVRVHIFGATAAQNRRQNQKCMEESSQRAHATFENGADPSGPDRGLNLETKYSVDIQLYIGYLLGR